MKSWFQILLSKQFNLCRCTGESQGELANTMGDMNAAKTRYEEKERIFQVGVEAAKEAAAAADELREDLRTQREDLRAAQRGKREVVVATPLLARRLR